MPETSPTDALSFLSESVRRLRQQGFFVTGSIVLHDFRKCPACKAETIFVDDEHLCPVCLAPVGLLNQPVKDNPRPPELVNLAADYLKGYTEPDNTPKMAADAPFCTQCGGQMMRFGTCYTCTNCGTTSGCG